MSVEPTINFTVKELLSEHSSETRASLGKISAQVAVVDAKVTAVDARVHLLETQSAAESILAADRGRRKRSALTTLDKTIGFLAVVATIAAARMG